MVPRKGRKTRCDQRKRRGTKPLDNSKQHRTNTKQIYIATRTPPKTGGG
jgi:hypothetical protein